MNIEEQREGVRRFLKQAARAQDDNQPLKALDVMSGDGDPAPIVWLQTLRMITVDDTTDNITVTIEGRLFAGLIVGDAPDFGPGKLAELRGTITETELAARYVEGKVRGVERAMKDAPGERDNLQWIGTILKNLADEFRQQMHVPAIILEGRVIPYNEDNDTGIKHSANLALFFMDVHERNCRAGWWSDLETGEPKKRNVGELLMLFVTEIVEAYQAYVENAPDDKLPDYPGLGVEIGDLGIRLADLAGALMAGKVPFYSDTSNPGEDLFTEIVEIANRYEAIRKTPAAIGAPEQGDFMPPMNVAEMIDVKLAFNANRADHKIENRLKPDGKKT